MIFKNRKIQRDIIDTISQNEKCAFGNIVKELDYKYIDLLSNIIKLKKRGKIKKLSNNTGLYTLKDN